MGNGNCNIKILPHGKNNHPTGPSTSGPRATPRRDPGFSWAGAGLGSTPPAWRVPGLVLPRPPSLWPEAATAARPRVSGPVAIVLTRWPAPGAGGGCSWEVAQPCTGAGGVPARERRGDSSFCCPSRGSPDVLLEAPAHDMSTSARGGPSRILSRRAAIPSESSLSSSPSFPSSSSGESSSDSPFCLDFARCFLSACRSRFFFFSFSSPSPLQTFAFLRTRVSSHDRRRPPLPEVMRTERRSIHVQASVSPKEDWKDRKLSNGNKKSSPG